MDLSQEEFKNVQDTPELILHTLEPNNNTTKLLLGTSMIQQILNTKAPTTTPVCLSDTSSLTFSSSPIYSDTDSKTDIDEDVLNDTVDDLKVDIKHLKYKICKLNDKNKELIKDNKELNSKLKRKTFDYGVLQNENLELLFTNNKKLPMSFLITIGSSISFGAAIALLYKIWN